MTLSHSFRHVGQETNRLVGLGKSTASDAAPRSFLRVTWRIINPSTEKIGNLIAICPDCDCIINRRVSLAKLEQVQGKMDITFPQALRHISESNQPTVNSDLG